MCLLAGQETSAWRRHKRSRDGTGSSTDVVATVTMTATFTKDGNLATTSSKDTVPMILEEQLAEAPQLLNQRASNNVSTRVSIGTSHGVPATASLIVSSKKSAAVVCAETPVTTQPALSLPAAGKKMCQPPRHCSWIVDEEGYSKEDCRPQRPTPPGFGNLCGDDIFTIVIFAFMVILVVLIRCSW